MPLSDESASNPKPGRCAANLIAERQTNTLAVERIIIKIISMASAWHAALVTCFVLLSTTTSTGKGWLDQCFYIYCASHFQCPAPPHVPLPRVCYSCCCWVLPELAHAAYAASACCTMQSPEKMQDSRLPDAADAHPTEAQTRVQGSHRRMLGIHSWPAVRVAQDTSSE